MEKKFFRLAALIFNQFQPKLGIRFHATTIQPFNVLVRNQQDIRHFYEHIRICIDIEM